MNDNSHLLQRPQHAAAAGATSRGRSRCSRRAFLRALVVACVGIAASGYSAAAGHEPTEPLRVVVISDLNESYGSTRYAESVAQAVTRIADLHPALVLNTGDMIAGQRLHPPLVRGEIDAMWSAFHQAVTEPLARAGVPMAVTPGNHDASSGARFRLEREIYREQWLPRRPALDFVDAANYPFSYAFSVGRVLFVSLDATFVGVMSEREREWLRDLLARHGARYSHRIVFSHVPVWPVAVGRENDYLGDEKLEAILQEGGVDLYLSGHHHAYYPGVKDGIRYVSQACLGAAPRALIGSTTHSSRAITLLEIPAKGPIGVEAYRAPEYTAKIDREELPARVTSRHATLVRDDLVPVQAPSMRR